MEMERTLVLRVEIVLLEGEHRRLHEAAIANGLADVESVVWAAVDEWLNRHPEPEPPEPDSYQLPPKPRR
jgi:hypothetical protein